MGRNIERMPDRMCRNMNDVVVMIVHDIGSMDMLYRDGQFRDIVVERRCMPAAERTHSQHGEERQHCGQYGGPGTV